MVIFEMLGKGVEFVDASELLWMRQAFDHEFTDAVMLRVGGSERLYSIETLDALRAKFQEAGAAMARFTPPDGNIAMLVNTGKVREVEPPNPEIFHANAGSVLKFSTRLRLAVRESEAESRAIIEAAAFQSAANVSAAAVATGAVLGAAVGAAAAAMAATNTNND